MMHPRIAITKIWSDDDMVEFCIHVCDGTFLFSNQVYVAHQRLNDVAHELEQFKAKLSGGIYDLQFGSFGPEYASGALDARLRVNDRGRILIKVRGQSDFIDFDDDRVASEATLYLVALPSQLDDFVRAFRAIGTGHTDRAELTAMSPA